MKYPIIFILLFIIGCASELKIDATDKDSMENSIEKIKETMSSEKQEEFEQAMETIVMYHILGDDIDYEDDPFAGFGALLGIAMKFAADEDAVLEKIKPHVHGKTAAAIFDEYERIGEERERKRRGRALEEIAGLKEKRDEAGIISQELEKFKIVNAEFYFQEDWMGRSPIIDLTVRNETDFPISRAYFKGTVWSSGRTIPWVQQTFNYMIRGGLEPNEAANWRLEPRGGRFSDWAKVPDRDDLIFDVVVYRLDGANYDVLFDRRIFTEDDEKRLSELMEKYQE